MAGRGWLASDTETTAPACCLATLTDSRLEPLPRAAGGPEPPRKHFTASRVVLQAAARCHIHTRHHVGEKSQSTVWATNNPPRPRHLLLLWGIFSLLDSPFICDVMAGSNFLARLFSLSTCFSLFCCRRLPLDNAPPFHLGLEIFSHTCARPPGVGLLLAPPGGHHWGHLFVNVKEHHDMEKGVQQFENEHDWRLCASDCRKRKGLTWEIHAVGSFKKNEWTTAMAGAIDAPCHKSGQETKCHKCNVFFLELFTWWNLHGLAFQHWVSRLSSWCGSVLTSKTYTSNPDTTSLPLTLVANRLMSTWWLTLVPGCPEERSKDLSDWGHFLGVNYMTACRCLLLELKFTLSNRFDIARWDLNI